MKWTIGKILITSFLVVAAITMVLGIVGYYGIDKGSEAINELGVVRLPSVESMLIVSEGQTAVDTTENALLSRAIHLNTRQGKYNDFAAIWQRIEAAWKIYEPLPQTDEEAATWKEFVPAWNEWKKDHQEYVKLSKEYDQYVEGAFLADEVYKKMIEQALVINGVSFGKSESLLNQIVEIYTSKAKTDQSNESFDRVAFLTIQSLLTMSEGQTAIDSSENALLSRGIDLKMREAQYDRIAGAWQRIDEAWKIYEPLEQTAEEKVLWSKFVPAWNEWKKDHETYVRLGKEYDRYVEDNFKADETYKKMRPS
jgi:methyl-accepting chemotaxis protein